MTAEPVIEAEGLTKTYGSGSSRLLALDSLDLRIERGGVFGLLGPNGAGKSTLMRIICGLVHPTAGRISLFGGRQEARSLRRLGALIETPRFPPYLTALELLELLARTSGSDLSQCPRLLDRVGLSAAADRRASGFSLGMKQRLGIAAALVGEPELLILDEPTNGMDPEGIQEIRLLVRSLAERDGLTVILSSHLLDEVQRTCDRVAILERGRLRQQASLDTLLQRRERLRIEAQPIEDALCIAGPNARQAGDAMLVDLPRSSAPDLLSALAKADVRIFEARWEQEGLEAIYFDRKERQS